MPGNSNLHDSSRNKQDEFYTNLQLIEDELKHYRAHFKGKRVLCNCDDPYESNFFKYFAMSFNSLGLKSLTATCYATSPVVYTQLDLFGEGGGPGVSALPKRGRGRARTPAAPRKIPYKIVINEVTDVNGDGRVDLADGRPTSGRAASASGAARSSQSRTCRPITSRLGRRAARRLRRTARCFAPTATAAKATSDAIEGRRYAVTCRMCHLKIWYNPKKRRILL